MGMAKQQSGAYGRSAGERIIEDQESGVWAKPQALQFDQCKLRTAEKQYPGYDDMTTAYCVQLPHSVYILQVPRIAHQEHLEHTGCLLAYSNPLHPESHWRHQRWYATRLLNIMLHASIQDTLAAKKGPSKRVGLSISGPHVWAGTDVLQNCGASTAGKPQPSCLPAGCRLTASQL